MFSADYYTSILAPIELCSPPFLPLTISAADTSSTTITATDTTIIGAVIIRGGRHHRRHLLSTRTADLPNAGGPRAADAAVHQMSRQTQPRYYDGC